MKAIHIGNSEWYRCPECYCMFRPIIHFEDYDFWECLPRVCPQCAKPFENGMEEV